MGSFNATSGGAAPSLSTSSSPPLTTGFQAGILLTRARAAVTWVFPTSVPVPTTYTIILAPCYEALAMRTIGIPMSFERGARPRLSLVEDDEGRIDVLVDGESVHRFPHAVAMKEGWTGALPDGSTLEVALRRKYGSLLARVDVRRDGRALPGSAWDPDRLVSSAAFILFMLGMWPLFEILGQRHNANPLSIATGLGLLVCGGIARATKRKRPRLTSIVLYASAFILVARTAVHLAIQPSTFTTVICLWLTTVLIRDARAAMDAPA